MAANFKKQNLDFLDGIRGLAAFYVMAGHARWLLWEGFSGGYLRHPQQYSILNKILVYFFSFFTYGHEMVLLFFVLSGILIHLKNAKRLSVDLKSKFNIANFYKRRFLRLYPAFIFSLLFTFSLDSLGVRLGFPIYFGTTIYEQINSNILNSLDFKTFIGNLFMLQNVYCDVFGSNSPNWSLMFEWWFYIFYPLFLFISKKNIKYSTFLMVVLFVLSLSPTTLPIKLLQYIFSMMVCWWVGVLLAEVYVGRIKISFKHLTLLILFFPIALILKNKISFQFYDLMQALGFFGVLAIFLSYKLTRLKSMLLKLKWLGDLSYTLYIVHFPILVLLSGWLMSKNALLPTHFGYVFLGITLATSFSWLIHFLIEKPFYQERV